MANEADDGYLLHWLSTSSSEVSVTPSLTLCCPSSPPPVLLSPTSQPTASRTSAQGFSSSSCQTAPPSGSRTRRTTRRIGTPPSSNYVASSTRSSMRSRAWRSTWKQLGRCGLLGSRGGGTMSGGLWEGRSWKGGSCWYASFNCSTTPRRNPDQIRLSSSATTEEIHFRTQCRRGSGTLCLSLSTLFPCYNPSLSRTLNPYFCARLQNVTFASMLDELGPLSANKGLLTILCTSALRLPESRSTAADTVSDLLILQRL